MAKHIKANRVTVHVTRKWNLGDFENVEISAGFDVEIEKGEDAEEVAEEYLDACSTLVQDHGKNYKRGSKK